MAGYELGFAGCYDKLTQNISYRQRGEYFAALFQKFGKNSSGILLDLACGTGSLSEVFAGLGYDVIGVDASCDMLAFAQRKKEESRHDILYLCQDMRELELYSPADCCVCALDSLNHLTSLKDVQTAFERVSLNLAPGGLFAFDVNTVEKHRHVLSGNTFVYDCDDVFCVWQNSECDPDDIVGIRLDFFCRNQNGNYDRQTEEFEERAYSREALENCLKNAGFQTLACYAGDTFEESKKDSERLVFLAKKEEK